MFDPSEIRDDHGRWSLEGATHALSHQLKSSKMGSGHRMPGGIHIRVSTSKDAGHPGPNHRVFIVSHPAPQSAAQRARYEAFHGKPAPADRHKDVFHSAHEAAAHALNVSARSEHPDSLGGAYNHLNASLFEKHQADHPSASNARIPIGTKVKVRSSGKNGVVQGHLPPNLGGHHIVSFPIAGQLAHDLVPIETHDLVPVK